MFSNTVLIRGHRVPDLHPDWLVHRPRPQLRDGSEDIKFTTTYVTMMYLFLYGTQILTCST